jgi:hypothetical protein
LDPKLAAYIAIDGMEKGIFTTVRLDQYVNDKKTDFINARRVINGLDRANLIAGYAHKYLKALDDCGRTPGPHPTFNSPRGPVPTIRP